MIQHRNRKRPRTVVGILLLLVALVAGAVCLASSFTQEQRTARVRARAAVEAVKERTRARQQKEEQARTSRAGDNGPAGGWNAEKAAEACERIGYSDRGLLEKILGVWLARNPETSRNEHEKVKAHVQNALASNTATQLEKEVAAHVDSPEEVLRIAHAYLAALAPLREAEQALTADLFVTNSRRPDVRFLPIALSWLVALRGLGELHAGDARAALGSALAAYRFLQVSANAEMPLAEFSQYAGHCRRPDMLVEQIISPLWKDAPLAAEERAHVVAIIGWRPSKEELVQSVYAFATEPPEEYLDGRDSGEKGWEVWLQNMSMPLLMRGALGLARDVEPLLGHPPYEVKTQFDALVKNTPKFAEVTRAMAWGAQALNSAYAARATREDLVRVAFALEDYRKEHGAYPVKLEEVPAGTLPPVPKDPETGAVYGYVSDGKTFAFERGPTPSGNMERVWGTEVRTPGG